MSIINKENKEFFTKVFLKAFAVSFVVYFFVFCRFWWGNHEWDYLKDGVKIYSGFFEARYSQHLPVTLFFDGNIVPVIFFLLSLMLLVMMFVLVASYLNVCKENSLLFISILLFSPHLPIIFYYLFIALPLCFWGLFGVCLLLYFDKKHSLCNVILGSVGFCLLLGSYPPILAFVLALFMGKKMHSYIENKQNFRSILFDSGVLGLQLVVGVVGFAVIRNYLLKHGMMNNMMYNVSVRGISDVVYQIFIEIIAPFNFLEIYKRLGGVYALFYFLVLVFGIFRIFTCEKKNKAVLLLFVVGLFLASRVPFILSASSYLAVLRVSFWGQMGLVAVLLSFILQKRSQWLDNLVCLVSVLFLFSFIKTDFEIQKVQWLGFNTERLFQGRLEERLFENDNFDLKKEYATLNVGYPDLHRRFCYKTCEGFDNDLLDSTVLPADLGKVLFWDEVSNPVDFRLGFWGNRLWIVGVNTDNLIKYLGDDYKEDLAYWMYDNSKIGLLSNDVYIKNNLLIMRLDRKLFNLNREKILGGFESLLQK